MGIFRKLFGVAASVKPLPPGVKTITAKVPSIGSFPFNIHASNDQYISGDLEATSIWEPFETEVFRRICTEGSFVLDIGANIGWYTKLAANLVGPNGKIFSFEPDSANFSLLCSNLSADSNSQSVTFYRAAVGEFRSTAKLYLSSTNLGDHHLFQDGESRPFEEIDVLTLDEILGSSKILPTLIKSDTQGSEAKIIRGAASLFRAGWRPDMIVEFWPYGLATSGDDPWNYWQSLRNLGYDIYRVHEAHPLLVKLDDAFIADKLATYLSPEARGHINFLCLPPNSPRLSLLTGLLEV